MMAASGQGASPTSYANASIIDVLLAYGSRSGALLAAYRHPDNPLLLTHVRWQGPGGALIEARRSPDDMGMVREEREAWARVALLSTTLRPDSVGPNAPWLQAPLDPREAYELANRAQRAREVSGVPSSHHSYSDHASAVHASGGPAHMPMRTPAYAPEPISGYAVASAPGYPGSAHGRLTPPPALGSSGEVAGMVVDPYGGYINARPVAPEPQNTGGWPREAFYQPHHTPAPPPSAVSAYPAPLSQPGEIVVIACIEIEMPALMTSSAEDLTRDFARDVALNFNRAARTIPQTRATRGWMTGAHMTLGALMALGTGARQATRGEMEHAADTLASALSQRTLPYVRLRFAEAAEWERGFPLPD